MNKLGFYRFKGPSKLSGSFLSSPVHGRSSIFNGGGGTVKLQGAHIKAGVPGGKGAF